VNPGIRGVPFVAAGSDALAARCGRGSWAFPCQIRSVGNPRFGKKAH
jgi:hypothetical protein